MTTDLSTWLLEQIAEEEGRAQRMQHRDIDDGGYYSCPATRPAGTDYGDLPSGEEHCDCGMPAERRRLLAECEAKRRIITEYQQVVEWYARPENKHHPAGEVSGLQIAVRHLAEVFATHPGYRDAWRP